MGAADLCDLDAVVTDEKARRAAVNRDVGRARGNHQRAIHSQRDVGQQRDVERQLVRWQRCADDPCIDPGRGDREMIGGWLAGIVDFRRVRAVDVARPVDRGDQVRDRVEIGVAVRVVADTVVERSSRRDPAIE